LPRSSPCCRARNVPDRTWSSSRFLGLPATTATICSVRNSERRREHAEAAYVLRYDRARLAFSNSATNGRTDDRHVFDQHGSRSTLLAQTDLLGADIRRVPFADDVAVAWVKLDEQGAPAGLFGSDQRRT